MLARFSEMRMNSPEERYIDFLINAFDLGCASALSFEWLIDRVEQSNRTDLRW